MISKGYKIDNDGYYIEDYIYEEGQKLESNITTIEIPQGFYKPKWDGTEWVEGATQEYINSIKAPTNNVPTTEERLASAESALSALMGV